MRVHTRKCERLSVPDELQVGVASVHLEKQTCTLGQDTIELNTKECGILRLLAQRQGGVVTRDEFLDHVWGYHANPTSRTVDNFITELRRKLGDSERNHLLTVRGQGYRLKIDVE